MIYRCIIANFDKTCRITDYQAVFEFESTHDIECGEFVYSSRTGEIFTVNKVVHGVVSYIFMTK